MAYAGVMQDEWVEQRGKDFVDPRVTSDDRMYGTFLNLVPLITLTGPGWIASIIVALVMWRIKAKDSDFLDDHGKEVVNFVLSLGVWVLILVVGGLVLSTATLGLAVPLVILVGVLVGLGGWVVILIGSIRGALAANKGQYHRYPVTFRFLQ